MVEGEQRGTVWPEDVPEDVLTGAEPQIAPGLTAVPAAPAAGAAAAKSDDEPRKRGHLKLVE